MVGYASALRKNPFPRVAHAGALGKEVLDLTVRTAGFDQLLEVVVRKGIQGEPLAVVVLGSPGSGKTHFLKFLEHTYRPAAEAWRDEGELSEDRAEPQFHRVIFVPNPGGSFAELVRFVIQGTLDPETLGRLVARLLAFPARALCLEKARQGEETEANERIAQLLRRNPEEIDNYWPRFSKSEIYNAALSALEQISRHPVFRNAFAELLRARRDGAAVDYERVLRGLVERWAGGGESAAGQAASERDFEAVQVAESVLALLNLLEIRILFMVDECQVVLRGENRTSENALFRELVNATPRGSMMAFALRTEDWLRFADEASERRVRFQKLTVSPEESWEIVLRYLVVKGGNPHLTVGDARALFPEEAARCLWSEAGGVVGRILTLCHEVHERLIAGTGNDTVTDVARAVAGEARNAVIAYPSSQAVASSVEDIVRNTCALLGRKVQTGAHGFDFEVLDQGGAQPAVVVALRQANNDIEEARRAHDVGKAILDLRETSPCTRILVVVSGYRSPEITELLGILADRVVILNENQWDSRTMFGEVLIELIREAENSLSKPYLPQEGLQWVDELAAVRRRRAAENARIPKSELRAAPTQSQASRSLPARSQDRMLVIASAFFSLLAVLLFLFVQQKQEQKSLEAEKRYQAAMSDFLGGQPAKMAVALGDIETILSESPWRVEPTRLALATYLRFAGMQSTRQVRQEVIALFERTQQKGGRPPDLHGAQLNEMDLRRIDLSGWNLTDANLEFADLHDADLRRAQLHNARLFGAKLVRANLLAADLRGADLRGADLTGVMVESLRDTCGDKNTILPAAMPVLRPCPPDRGRL